MRGDPFVSLIVCSPRMVCATAMLNGNGFPPELESEAAAVARRLAIFLHHVDVLPSEIENSNRAFFDHLIRNWAPYLAAIKKRGDVEHIAFSDGLGYLACLHSILYEMKAFLDLFVRLICRLAAATGGPLGFNKGKVAGSEIAGGRFINWLVGQPTNLLPNRDPLVALFTDVSEAWITDAVSTRDTLGHYRDLPGFCHMRISLSQCPATLSRSDILSPQMPDGQDLVEYVQRLRERLCVLVSDVLPLLPNVRPELHEKWRTAERHLYE